MAGEFNIARIIPGTSLEHERPEKTESHAESDETFRLLQPVPEGYLSMKAVTARLRISEKTAHSIAAEISEEIGELKPYLFGHKAGIGLSPSQITMIETKLEEAGPRSAPEGYLNTKALAESLGFDWNTIDKTARHLGENLGEMFYYHLGKRAIKAYSPRQQAQIIELLTDTEPLPEGYASRAELHSLTGTHWGAIDKVIEGLRDHLGPRRVYRTKRGPSTEYFSPEEQDLILTKMEELGYFTEPAPEGYLSFNRVTNELGVTPKILKQAIKRVGESLGAVQRYKVQYNVVDTYSPEQIDLVKQELDSLGLLVPSVPDGCLSLKGMAREFDYPTTTLRRAIRELGDELGTIERFKFMGGVGQGYSKIQQEKIIRHLTSLEMDARLDSDLL